eukprot:2878281-Amphidinium_carterae.1
MVGACPPGRLPRPGRKGHFPRTWCRTRAHPGPGTLVTRGETPSALANLRNRSAAMKGTWRRYATPSLSGDLQLLPLLFREGCKSLQHLAKDGRMTSGPQDGGFCQGTLVGGNVLSAIPTVLVVVLPHTGFRASPEPGLHTQSQAVRA